MTDSPTPTDHVITDHPRAAELDEIWQELWLRRPAGVEADRELTIVKGEFALPICLFTEVSVPAVFIGDRPADELAYGLAYATALNPTMQWAKDAKPWMEGDLVDDDSPLAIPYGVLLGITGGITAIYMGFTRFSEREQEAIDTAVDWVYRAGFDPNAGVRLFMSLSGWFAAQAEGKERVELSTWQKLKAVTVLAPLVGMLAVPMSKNLPMVTAVDRAAAVRTAVVARGLHR